MYRDGSRLFALCTLACFTLTARAEVTVLRNFTLIDGTGRAPVAAAALTIDADRIGWVGPVSELKVPGGASTVDLSGKYLLPGLIDSHVQDFGDVLVLIFNFLHFLLETFAVTALASEVNIGHKLHFDLHLAFTLTNIATATLYVKRESSGF